MSASASPTTAVCEAETESQILGSHLNIHKTFTAQQTFLIEIIHV